MKRLAILGSTGSIGVSTLDVVARNPDGTVKLGPDNLPIQTYDNDVIKEMAQVFTGLSFSKTSSGGTAGHWS